MLGISRNRIDRLIKEEDFKSFDVVSNPYRIRTFAYWLVLMLAAFVVILFMPWTQSVTADGDVTSLRPGERHQTIHSTLPGRIEAWHVIEGQRVSKGDTIVKIGEIRSEYFNPKLLERLQEQIDAKKGAFEAHIKKKEAIEKQVLAVIRARELRIHQLNTQLAQFEARVKKDSANFSRFEVKLTKAEQEHEAAADKYPDGISSQEWNMINNRLNEMEARFLMAESQYIISQNEFANFTIQITSAESEFANKISSAESDLESAISQLYNEEEQIAILTNKYENYAIRNSHQYITAPQDGYITKAQVSGVGEIVREGQAIISIMPKHHELAAELYVDPVDAPLIQLHHKVRLQFDGWPAIVASGWPDLAYGVFSGEVVAIDNIISDNGKYRVLVSPDHSDRIKGRWPNHLRLGSGVKGLALLNRVPVYKELWRRLNGFPPEWYDKNKRHPYVHDKIEDAKRKGLVPQ